MARRPHADRSDPDAGADGASPRLGHLEARLRRAIQTVLAKGLNDPRVRGLVSVVGLDLSPDLAHGTVRVSVLPESAGPLALAGLKHAAGRLQTEVGRLVKIRRIPRFHFQLDDSLKRQAALEALLKDDREATS